MRRKNRTQVTSDDDSDSDYNASDSSDTSNKPKRKRGRPAGRKVQNKKQRVLDDSDDDVTAQPSTSQNGNGVGNANEESESDSGSETPDSDYEHIIDRSSAQKKTVQKKKGRSKAASNQKKTHNDQNSSNASQKRNLNVSTKKVSRPSTSNGIVSDPKAIEALAQKCVYFLLIEDQKKYAIKRKAIVTHVFKDENYSPKLYVAVLKKANSILKKTYGMELMELENQKDSYLIVNILRRELGILDYVELSRLKQQQHGLILYIVTVIYMNDNMITEDELTKALKPLGIDLTAKRLHPVFGDVKKYITTELVKQMYLNYECVSKDPPKYEITWGIRAKQEFGKMELLQFVCQIIDDTSPSDWKIQYKDAKESTSKPND